jgi:hypothetical protein
MLIITEMSHLALQRTLSEGCGELVERAVVAEHFIGRLVVFEQFW